MNSSKQNDSKQLPIALILGTGHCALGTIRSLKANPDIPIIVMGNREKGLAQHSRYVDDYYPCDQNDLSNVYRVLKKIDDSYDKVIPIPTGSDFWVDVMINSPVEFKHFITDLKPHYSDLMKKSVQQILAEKCRVPYPASIEIKNKDDLGTACETLEFPCVVKPVSRASGTVPFRIRTYKTPDQLKGGIQGLLNECDFLASDLIPGPDKNIYTYGSFAVKGEVKAEYFGRKLTQRPMHFGVAGIAESIYDVPQLRTYSTAMLKDIGFSGISQIEFKKSTRDGKFYLMEINPRIWLWMQAAAESKVNIALAYYSHLAGLREKKYHQSGKCMFISGLSMFDNTFREKDLTWLPYYLKSRFTRHIYSIKDRRDPEPFRIERRRFLKKFIRKTIN